MDPFDPLDAQQIVIAYARVLERDLTENRHPARVDSLPFAKPVIKDAICTSARQLVVSGQLSDEMREYLQTACTMLAEYVEPELANLMTEYRRSAEELAATSGVARDKAQTPAWRTLAETSALAGEVARAATSEAEALLEEFRAAITPI
jgi:hypothetical protein